jgi:hypothetical protein
MNAKKPTPEQMKSTVWTMLELDLIYCEEMRDLAQWMLEEYRTFIAREVIKEVNTKLKAEGKVDRYDRAYTLRLARRSVDIIFDGELIDSCARSAGLILKGAEAEEGDNS